MISRFTILTLLAVPLSFGIMAGGMKLWRAEQAARAEQETTATVRSSGASLAVADQQSVDLLSTALLHWQVCEGGKWSSAEGRLLTTARTVTARYIDPEDPAVEKALEASVERHMRDLKEQGQASWCASARAKLDQRLS